MNGVLMANNNHKVCNLVYKTDGKINATSNEISNVSVVSDDANSSSNAIIDTSNDLAELNLYVTYSDCANTDNTNAMSSDKTSSVKPIRSVSYEGKKTMLCSLKMTMNNEIKSRLEHIKADYMNQCKEYLRQILDNAYYQSIQQYTCDISWSINTDVTPVNTSAITNVSDASVSEYIVDPKSGSVKKITMHAEYMIYFDSMDTGDTLRSKYEKYLSICDKIFDELIHSYLCNVDFVNLSDKDLINIEFLLNNDCSY